MPRSHRLAPAQVGLQYPAAGHSEFDCTVVGVTEGGVEMQVCGPAPHHTVSFRSTREGFVFASPLSSYIGQVPWTQLQLSALEAPIAGVHLTILRCLQQDHSWGARGHPTSLPKCS